MSTQNPMNGIIVKIVVDYNTWNEKVKKLDPAVYAKLRSELRAVDLPEDQNTDVYFSIGDHIAPYSDVFAWMDAGIQIRIGKVKGISYTNRWWKLETAFRQARDNGGPRDGSNLPNITNVVVPGAVGLLDIKTVTVIEDACTDELQQHLKLGWKILAVCPPNDARRPDYIIGHADINMDRGR